MRLFQPRQKKNQPKRRFSSKSTKAAAQQFLRRQVAEWLVAGVVGLLLAYGLFVVSAWIVSWL